MDNISESVFNYCVGGLALVGAIISVILFCRAYLPGAQMKLLDELLKETNDIYEKAAADGLLPCDIVRHRVQRRLSSFENTNMSLRERTYRATTTLDEYVALIRGLSRKIMIKSCEVKKLRSYIITTSEEQRREGNNRPEPLTDDNLQTRVPAPDPRFAVVNQLPGIPGSPVRRSRSCPPILRCTTITATSVLTSTIQDPELALPPTQLDPDLQIPELDAHSLSPTLVSRSCGWPLRHPLVFIKRWTAASKQSDVEISI